MKNEKIVAQYSDRILLVKLLDGAEISEDDLIELYANAENVTEDQRYGIIFHALGTYNVSEDAIPFMVDNPYNNMIVQKIYVVDSAESELKSKLHLKFDKPSLLPMTVRTMAEALEILKALLEKN